MSKQFSPTDVIQMTGLSRRTIEDLFRSADFPSYKIGKRWFVDEKDFVEWRSRKKQEKAAGIEYASSPLLEKARPFERRTN